MPVDAQNPHHRVITSCMGRLNACFNMLLYMHLEPGEYLCVDRTLDQVLGGWCSKIGPAWTGREQRPQTDGTWMS